MQISDHFICLLRNLYAGQEAIVSTGNGTMVPFWERSSQIAKGVSKLGKEFQIGKGVHQDCILSPCLFNLYEDYIM